MPQLRQRSPGKLVGALVGVPSLVPHDALPQFCSR
jgi:hypothetical protein